MPHHRRHVPHSDDPKIKAYFERLNKRADIEDHIFRRTLHILERFIAVITILGLMAPDPLHRKYRLLPEGYP